MALVWEKCGAWLTGLHAHAPNRCAAQTKKVRTHELWSHQIDEHLLFHYSEIKEDLRFKNYNLYLNLYTTNNIYTSTNIATKAFIIHCANFLSKTSHMITNNAPLPNAFTNEEPKHNFCCYKRVQPCFLEHNKQYRNGIYQLSITSSDRKAFPRQNRNIKDKKYFMDI